MGSHKSFYAIPLDVPLRCLMGPWKFVIADRTGFAERLIGPIRRECVDNIIVLGEAHLRRVAHYN